MKDLINIAGAWSVSKLQMATLKLSLYLGLNPVQRVVFSLDTLWVQGEEGGCILYLNPAGEYPIEETVVAERIHHWGSWVALVERAPDGGGVTYILSRDGRVPLVDFQTLVDSRFLHVH